MFPIYYLSDIGNPRDVSQTKGVSSWATSFRFIPLWFSSLSHEFPVYYLSDISDPREVKPTALLPPAEPTISVLLPLWSSSWNQVFPVYNLTDFSDPGEVSQTA